MENTRRGSGPRDSLGNTSNVGSAERDDPMRLHHTTVWSVGDVSHTHQPEPPAWVLSFLWTMLVLLCYLTMQGTSYSDLVWLLLATPGIEHWQAFNDAEDLDSFTCNTWPRFCGAAWTVVS